MKPKLSSGTDDDQLIKDNLDIANGFNEFFSQVGPKLASDIKQSDVSFDSFLSDSNPVNFESH